MWEGPEEYPSQFGAKVGVMQDSMARVAVLSKVAPREIGGRFCEVEPGAHTYPGFLRMALAYCTLPLCGDEGRCRSSPWSALGSDSGSGKRSMDQSVLSVKIFEPRVTQGAA